MQNAMTLQEILGKLITFKTVTRDREANKAALEWIEAFVKPLPVHVTKFSSNEFDSMLITTKKTKTPDIWLVAHLDVVAGSPDVFVAKARGGKLWGRGTYDMKFALACYLQLFQELGNDLKKYNIGIMITTDEEIGGVHGVGALMKKGYGGNVAILPDGGDYWRIEAAAKGVFHFLLESKGSSAHGSRPWEGENAIDVLIDCIDDLKEEISFVCKDACAHAHGTLNVGQISGGQAVNQIPDYAKAGIDIRFMDDKELKKVQAALKKILKKYPSIKLSHLSFGSSFATPLKNPYVQKFRTLVEQHTGKKNLQPILSHGSSDARFFAEKKIPTIVIRPDGGGHHSEKEWIDGKGFITFYNVLKEFVTTTQ